MFTRDSRISPQILIVLAGLALAVGLAACASAGSGAERPPLAPRRIELPHDNAMHPGANTEWWYFVGHVTDGRRPFGFETTLFKFHNVRVSGSPQPLTIYRYDVALSDIDGHRYLPTVTYVEPGLAPVKLSTTSFSERIGTAHVWYAAASYHVNSLSRGARLALRMISLRRPLLEGGTGVVPMGSRGFSYYYSLTHLKVSGRIYYQNHWIHVHGIAWMDHQWGSWQWSQIHSWTWGGFHLDNGVDFSVSDFHASGASLHGVSVSFPGGKQQTVTAVSISKLGTWKSPFDGAVYSSGWRVTMRGMKARLTVRPLLKNQEMYDRLAPPESYWEGACSVTGVFLGKRVSGHAYMELVGASGRFGSF
jgi:predicted secreted hydrolase